MENICDDHQPPLLDLPRDVLVQILIFLPVISLLRFKSVCKSWRAIIQSSFFIDLHANTLMLMDNFYSSNFGTFIFQTQGYIEIKTMESEAFMLSSGSGSGGGDEFEVDLLKLEDLGFPTCYKNYPCNCEIFMVGSFNGLICLHDTKGRDASLWNPATRQFRLLPKSLTLSGIGNLVQDFVLFGYDFKTKDYKVVQISQFRPYMSGDGGLHVEEYIFRVQVYNLSTDSWRLLEGINSLPAIPYQAMGLNHGVCLNGSYYFLGSYFVQVEVEYRTGTITETRKREMILLFHFTEEIFTTIQLPHDYHITTILTYLGEKLAIFAMVRAKDESDPDIYDIWVLNEHMGMKEEPWTKIHSVGPYFNGIPRGISNNGEFALIANKGHNLQLFNLVTKKQVKEDFPTGHLVIRAYVYKQSLVPIGATCS